MYIYICLFTLLLVAVGRFDEFQRHEVAYDIDHDEAVDRVVERNKGQV